MLDALITTLLNRFPRDTIAIRRGFDGRSIRVTIEAFRHGDRLVIGREISNRDLASGAFDYVTFVAEMTHEAQRVLDEAAEHADVALPTA